MSLNKHDLDSYRRAKRQRAQKNDVLIILLFVLIALVITLDRPPPGPGAPAFHRPQTSAKTPPKLEAPVIARALN